jgi:hypothetical protein
MIWDNPQCFQYLIKQPVPPPKPIAPWHSSNRSIFFSYRSSWSESDISNLNCVEHSCQRIPLQTFMDKQWEHKIGRRDARLLECSPKSRRFPVATGTLCHVLNNTWGEKRNIHTSQDFAVIDSKSTQNSERKPSECIQGAWSPVFLQGPLA